LNQFKKKANGIKVGPQHSNSTAPKPGQGANANTNNQASGGCC